MHKPAAAELAEEEAELGELEDRTEALTLRSKRTERRSKKMKKKKGRLGGVGVGGAESDTSSSSEDGRRRTTTSLGHALLARLPAELLFAVAALLRPSDVLALRAASRAWRDYVDAAEAPLAAAIARRRYDCLRRCYPLPVLLDQAVPLPLPPGEEGKVEKKQRQEREDEEGEGGKEKEEEEEEDEEEEEYARQLRRQLQLRADLQRPGRLPSRPYQHIPPADPAEICTCLTCHFRWAALCLAADFAAWQGRLDRGEPIPMVARGSEASEAARWNRDLLAAHAARVRACLRRPLWHARLLQSHLASTRRSIARHAANARGNRRRRFRLDDDGGGDDGAGETDAFLEAEGPASYDFPFHRDNYYMLEAYMPNRGWSSERRRWVYVPLDQHEADLERFRVWCDRAREEEEEERGEGGGGGGRGPP